MITLFAVLGMVLALAPAANAQIVPITNVTTSGSIDLETFTVGAVTYTTATYLSTGTSVKTDAYPLNERVIGNQDNFDLNLLFSRGKNGGDFSWNTISFGGQNWYDTNGNAADFFVFEANGNDTLSVAPIFTDGSVGQYVQIAANGSNWGSTGVTITGPVRTGQTIFGVAFAITDLKDAAGAALSNSTVIKGLAFDGPNTDIASISAVPVPLTGSIIGTPGSWYSTGGTIYKVFDGDVNTYFDAPMPGIDAWVGLDFGDGNAATVTKICFYPRSGFTHRMINGKFQGSNDASFSAPVDLYTITANPPLAWNAIPVSNPGKFRYVRYLSVGKTYGNIAEFQLFGNRDLPAVEITTPSQSIVSPAFVEACVQDLTPVTVTVNDGAPFDAVQLNHTTVYADSASAGGGAIGIPLSPSAGTQVVITSATASDSQTIVWSPTDIATAPANIKVRVGDSLLLSCTGSGDILEIDDSYDSGSGFISEFTGAPGDTYQKLFDTPGVYDVQARIDGIEIATIEVTVIGIDFQGSTACEVGYERNKAVKVLGGATTDVTIAAADYKLVVTLDSMAADIQNLKLRPLFLGMPTMIARLGAGGPIIAVQEVDEFDLSSQAGMFIGVVDEFEDGSMLLRTNLTMFPKVNDLEVRLHIFVSGVTFDDSTIDKTVNTTNFTLDEESLLYLHPYELIIPADYAGGPCHTIMVFQHGVQIGQ